MYLELSISCTCTNDQIEIILRQIGNVKSIIIILAQEETYHTGVYFRNNFDDTEESILKRIDSYNQKTKPVADKFEAKIVSAERTADEIFPDVQAIMDGVK